MPSGKQTSFQYGEVSPLNHYRSNDAAYSNALHTLDNMYVRRQGGVSKRPATKLSNINANQENSPTGEISYQRYKMFSFPSKVGQLDSLINVFLHMKVDGDTEVDISAGSGLVQGAYVFRALGEGGLNKVKALYHRGTMYIYGLSVEESGVVRSCVARILYIDHPYFATPTLEYWTIPALPNITFPAAQGNAFISTGPILATAVQYLITVEYSDGREVVARRYETAAYDAKGFAIGATAASLIMPGDGIITGFSDTISFQGTQVSELKAFNIYRAPVNGSASAISNMTFVGKLPQDIPTLVPVINPVAVYALPIQFTDTGVNIESITPPVDFSLFTSRTVGGFPVRALEGASCACIYQERQIIGYDEFDNPVINAGDLTVSKIGGPSQIALPIISRASQAFQINIPVEDGTETRALIGGERLVGFSAKGTYVIQGGENGILTPTSINPIQISTEGCSAYVNPLKVGTNIVYLNDSHTKLMYAYFGLQSQAGVLELSLLSDHLLEGDRFIEMHLMPGVDNTVLLLKQSGELLAVSINEDNVAGFAPVDLNGGRVETMTNSGDPSRPYLLISMLRDGIRSLETIAYYSKQDLYRSISYCDQTVMTGAKLMVLREGGYYKAPAQTDTQLAPWLNNYVSYLNIEAITDYTMGTTFNVVSATQLAVLPAGYGFADSLDSIKHFYLENGELRYLYITLLDAGVWDGVNWTYTARADIDVPAYLQDVDAQVLTTDEKQARSSRWLPAFKKLTNPQSNIGITALYILNNPEATFDPLVIPDGEVDVAIFADEKVYSSPLNPHQVTMRIVKETGVDAYIQFDEPITYAEVGTPYQSTMQTLPIEVGEGRTLTDDKKIIDKVGLALYNTTGGFIGTTDADIPGMAPMITRDNLDPGQPDVGFSGYIAPIIPSKWTRDGMIKIVHVDPVPMTVLSVYPKGQAGD